MKVVGIIPSRYGSSRFPGKPLIDLMGKSMIQRVYEGAVSCTDIHQVLVATDDPRIFDEVLSFGGQAFLSKHPHPNGTSRCAELAKDLDADIVINIQGDEPLVQPEQLKQIIDLFRNDQVQIGTLVKEISETDQIQDVNRVKAVLDAEDRALYFSRAAIPFGQNPTTNQPYYKHIGLYAFRRHTLLELVQLPTTMLEEHESLEQLRWLYHGYKIHCAKTLIETPNIDTPEDVEAVLSLIR